MKVEQLYTKCLSQSSYFIVSGDEAVVVDPIREFDPYLDMASQHGATIKYVLETHFHADFVSGHIDLADKTNAQIVFGPGAKPEYDALVAKDGQILEVGNSKIKVVHTPGHTPESTSYLLYDEQGAEQAIFTGDTLFVGDVGRPDLAVKSDLSKEDLAGMLYDSLNEKIKTLPDDLIVYPGHGAGSSCGKNIGTEASSTIGQEKLTNYAMADMSRERFIELVTEGLGEPPSYFFDDARINKEGYESIDKVLEENVIALELGQVETLVSDGALVLDTRSPDEFREGHIPGALNIGLGGQYAIWAGTLIKIDQPIIVIANEGKEREAILRLARVGYENVKGFLEGGTQTWKSGGHTLAVVLEYETTKALEMVEEGMKMIDVRKPGEYAAGHVDGTENYSLQDLEEQLHNLDATTEYLVHCKSGYRSMIACSILKKHGFEKVYNVKGGYLAFEELNVPMIT